MIKFLLNSSVYACEAFSALNILAQDYALPHAIVMFKRFVVALTSSIAIGAGFAGAAAAAEEVTFTLSFNGFGGDPDTVAIGLCSTFGLCSPGQEIFLPDPSPGQETPALPAVNDTGFNITGLFGRLPLSDEVPGLDQPSVFSQDGSSSDIFNEINVFNEQQEIAFAEGIISAGSIVEVNVVTEPTANSSLFARFEGESIPEPASTLAVLAFGVVAAGGALKKKEA